MNGKNSDFYQYFKSLLIKGFVELRKHIDDLIYLLEIMMENSKLECFRDFSIQ